jgi:hypothetical protein
MAYAVYRLTSATHTGWPGPSSSVRSYGMPALKLHGKGLLGFIRAKGWLSLFPHSDGLTVPDEPERLDRPASRDGAGGLRRRGRHH